MKVKSSLSLYKRYRRPSTTKPSTKRFLTPEKSVTKRFKTISSNSTPKASSTLKTREKSTNKRVRNISPKSSPQSSRRSPYFLATKLRSPKHLTTQYTIQEWVDVEEYVDNNEEPSIHPLLFEFKRELENVQLWVFFERFMELVVSKTYPLDNIALLLFLDTVKFFDSASTSSMMYFPQTKRFWKAGLRLFHTKFLYFMGGPKSVGQLDEFEEFECYSPKLARINFAVPSMNVLSTFDVLDGNTTQRMPTGMLDSVLKSISNSETNKQYMLCADAKKVTAGIDKLGGDVDLFGFEDGIILEERKRRLSAETELMKTAMIAFKDNSVADESILGQMRDAVTIVSERVKEVKDLRKRQEYGLKKFMTLGGDKWRDSKYVYAISALQASVFQINSLQKSALNNLHCLCQVTSVMGQAIEFTGNSTHNVIQMDLQSNMMFLNPDFKTDIIDPRHIIQRSELWFEMRKLASVTGSTMHDAIGLRGLQSQKKHMEKLTQTDAVTSDFYDLTKQRMQYGTENEVHALATIADSILPTFYPSCMYVEEGCYAVQGSVKDILMVISPDGSVRDDGQVVAAVEVKCPFPTEGKTMLHYELPRYYVCQCLSEMYALETDKLLYASWSPQSTVALEVTFDDVLFNKIFTLVKDTYDTSDAPRRPKDTPGRLKDIKQDIARFVKTHVRLLAEVPSAMMIGSVNLAETSSPYSLPSENTKRDQMKNSYNVTENAMLALSEGIKTIQSAYDLQRRKATEIMVWVLTHKDRNTKSELPCSVLIAYGMKDYKLTSNAFRKAYKYVVGKCQENGIQICSISTDGQWIQLMTRDDNGEPLTMLQHQKDVWKKVTKMSKIELCKAIAAYNKRSDDEAIVVVEKKDGVFNLTSRSTAARKIKTPNRAIPIPVSLSEPYPEPTHSPDWMPEELISVLRDSDNLITEIAGSIDKDLCCPVSLSTCVQKSPENNDGENQDLPNVADPESMATSNEQRHESGASETQIMTNGSATDPVYTETSSVGIQSNVFHVDGMTPELLAEYMHTKLNDEKVSKDGLLSMIKGEKSFTCLTHRTLDIIIVCAIDNTKSNEILRKSWNKEKKASLLLRIINGEPVNTTRRLKNPSKLSSLCEKVLRSQKMPKHVLNVVYASSIYEDEYRKWKSTQPDIPLPKLEDDPNHPAFPFWYSYPEEVNNQLIGKSLDCSHNLTHLRVRSCTTGIGEISPDAWKAVSKENSTRLNRALVEDLIDKQSVPNARTNFSMEVEQCMRRLGYFEAADVTKLIRNWYDACDTPGIGAECRVKHLIEMRQFLLKDVSFHEFPPPSKYINKIPLITFEGLLIDIDTKIQLHATIGPYNIRSVGSLAAETMVGVLQQLNPVSAVSIKARDVPNLVTNAVEVMTCKLNQDRGFHMRTARRSGVYPVHEADECDTSSVSSNRETENALVIKDHPFDRRRPTKRKIRFGTVSGPSAPSRGALPVRQYHRKDESKILPTKRLGIDFMDTTV